MEVENGIQWCNTGQGRRSSEYKNFKGCMGHAQRGSYRGCCIDEIHAFMSPITDVDAEKKQLPKLEHFKPAKTSY